MSDFEKIKDLWLKDVENFNKLIEEYTVEKEEEFFVKCKLLKEKFEEEAEIYMSNPKIKALKDLCQNLIFEENKYEIFKSLTSIEREIIIINLQSKIRMAEVVKNTHQDLIPFIEMGNEILAQYNAIHILNS
jgi:hypothetical protein